MTSGEFVDIRAALNGFSYSPCGTVFAVDGTVYPGAPFPPPPVYGCGFASDIGAGLIDACDGLWSYVGIGYPAAMFPMGASMNAGVQNLVAAIAQTPAGWPIALTGYSQGAMVVATVWVNEILSPTGSLHHRLGDIKAIFQFGDPMRCPGIAYGNQLAGIPLPKTLEGQVTGGISGAQDLTAAQTPPDLYYSFALDGDLYASAPVGSNPWSAEAEVGTLETRIYNFVQQGSFMSFVSMAAHDLADIFKEPVQTVIAAAEAIFNGLSFAAQGGNSPHYQYGPYVPAAVNRLVQIGQSLPHSLGA